MCVYEIYEILYCWVGYVYSAVNKTYKDTENSKKIALFADSFRQYYLFKLGRMCIKLMCMQHAAGFR